MPSLMDMPSLVQDELLLPQPSQVSQWQMTSALTTRTRILSANVSPATAVHCSAAAARAAAMRIIGAGLLSVMPQHGVSVSVHSTLDARPGADTTGHIGDKHETCESAVTTSLCTVMAAARIKPDAGTPVQGTVVINVPTAGTGCPTEVVASVADALTRDANILHCPGDALAPQSCLSAARRAALSRISRVLYGIDACDDESWEAGPGALIASALAIPAVALRVTPHRRGSDAQGADDGFCGTAHSETLRGEVPSPAAGYDADGADIAGDAAGRSLRLSQVWEILAKPLARRLASGPAKIPAPVPHSASASATGSCSGPETATVAGQPPAECEAVRLGSLRVLTALLLALPLHGDVRYEARLQSGAAFCALSDATSGISVFALAPTLPYVIPALCAAVGGGWAVDLDAQLFAIDGAALEARRRGHASTGDTLGLLMPSPVLASSIASAHPHLRSGDASGEVRAAAGDAITALLSLGRPIHSAPQSPAPASSTASAPSPLAAYLGDVILAVHALTAEMRCASQVLVRVSGARALYALATHHREAAGVVAAALARSLLGSGCVRHRSAVLRAASIAAFDALIGVPGTGGGGGGSRAIATLLGLCGDGDDPNMHPISTFYATSSSTPTINTAAALLSDSSDAVRCSFIAAVGSWMCTLPDRGDWSPRLMPYLLVATSDTSVRVQRVAIAALDALSNEAETDALSSDPMWQQQHHRHSRGNGDANGAALGNYEPKLLLPPPLRGVDVGGRSPCDTRVGLLRAAAGERVPSCAVTVCTPAAVPRGTGILLRRASLRLLGAVAEGLPRLLRRNGAGTGAGGLGGSLGADTVGGQEEDASFCIYASTCPHVRGGACCGAGAAASHVARSATTPPLEEPARVAALLALLLAGGGAVSASGEVMMAVVHALADGLSGGGGPLPAVESVTYGSHTLAAQPVSSQHCHSLPRKGIGPQTAELGSGSGSVDGSINDASRYSVRAWLRVSARLIGRAVPIAAWLPPLLALLPSSSTVHTANTGAIATGALHVLWLALLETPPASLTRSDPRNQPEVRRG